MKIQKGSIIVVFLLILSIDGTFNPSHAQDQDPQKTEGSARFQEVENTIDAIDNRLANLESELDGYVQLVIWVGSIGALVLSFLGYLGWNWLRDSVKKNVESNLERTVNSSLEKELPQLLSQTQVRAEKFLLRLARLLALRSIGAYDEALVEFGWDGHVSSLRNESPTLRRAIVECLYAAKKNRDEDRAAAWEAITELVQDDNAPETNRLYLRLATTTRRYQEGLSFYERVKDDVLTDKDSALRVSTLLRKVGRVDEALEIAERFRTEDDMTTSVTVAVLQRDLGMFDEVHDILLPQVNKLIASPSSDLPDGWHRVVNTFIANCLDRDRPQDAVQSAEFVVRSAPGAVETFTVGRLIRALPEEHPSREPLSRKFRETVARLILGEATTRCQVVLAQLENDPEEAIRILKDAIDRGTLPQGKGMKNEVYFSRCNLGEILSGLERTGEAIDVLMPAAGFSYGGEAKFHLAVAYAVQGEGTDASRWIEQAILETPKWSAHARDHEKLSKTPEVIEKLAKLGQGH